MSASPSRAVPAGIVGRVPRFVDFEVDPVTLARRLLGQRLVRVDGGRRLAGTIVEVEAYLGPDDRAAHSFGNRRTARNETMYLAGGHGYVYFIYGMHYCFNVVCGGADEPVAVLLRALEPTEGVEEMFDRRGGARRVRDLCSGPAKLTQALGVDRQLDGVDLIGGEALWIERLRRRALPAGQVRRTRRVGVDYAGAWAQEPLRFLVDGNLHVSRQSHA
ncbi:MAG: DNA-3-methyladenine glycosylase [Planctomycetota bacterium]|jgi:DNA-3-methyladenine glycosylase